MEIPAISQATSVARIRQEVLGVPIDVGSEHTAVNKIVEWAKAGQSRSVFACNAHSVVTARKDPAFSKAVQLCDMATPDGAPVAWLMRQSGHSNQQRVSGPELMWSCCEKAASCDQAIYLYGSTPETLERLTAVLTSSFPLLRIVGAFSPPFRKLAAREEEEIVTMINASAASIVRVGLGCPKQELWIESHRGKIMAVMVGVGAAFDFHAGVKRRAPMLMQKLGLEWLFRLAQEPRRLAARYFVTNANFIGYLARELARGITSQVRRNGAGS